MLCKGFKFMQGKKNSLRRVVQYPIKPIISSGVAYMTKPNRYNRTEYKLHGFVQKNILFGFGSILRWAVNLPEEIREPTTNVDVVMY